MAYLAFWWIQSISQVSDTNKTKPSAFSVQQQTVNARTGKIERVFVNLEAVYPDPEDTKQEFSFEELRAKHRGWLDMQWTTEKITETNGDQVEDRSKEQIEETFEEVLAQSMQPFEDLHEDSVSQTGPEVICIKEGSREGRNGRPRRMKVMELKAETQTSECEQFVRRWCLMLF